LKLELARLDSLLSAYYANAAEGYDMPSAYLCLKIMDQKARLLGLYPDRDKPQTLIAVNGAGGERQPALVQVEFVIPGKGGVQPIDVDAEVGPIEGQQLLLPAPARTLRKTAFGTWEEG
jgi:hypothetical protein